MHPPPTPGWADFTIMLEFTPESGPSHFCILCGVSVGGEGEGREGEGRAMYLAPWSVSDQLLIPPLIGKAENNELLHGHEKMI